MERRSFFKMVAGAVAGLVGLKAAQAEKAVKHTGPIYMTDSCRFPGGRRRAELDHTASARLWHERHPDGRATFGG